MPIVPDRDSLSRQGLIVFRSLVTAACLIAVALACTTNTLRAQGIAQERGWFRLDAEVPGSLHPVPEEIGDQIAPSRLLMEPRPAFRSLAYPPPAMLAGQEGRTASRTLTYAAIGLVAGFTLEWVLDQAIDPGKNCNLLGECHESLFNSGSFYRVVGSALGAVYGAWAGSRGETLADSCHRASSRGHRLPR